MPVWVWGVTLNGVVPFWNVGTKCTLWFLNGYYRNLLLQALGFMFSVFSMKSITPLGRSLVSPKHRSAASIPLGLPLDKAWWTAPGVIPQIVARKIGRRHPWRYARWINRFRSGPLCRTWLGFILSAPADAARISPIDFSGKFLGIAHSGKGVPVTLTDGSPDT